MKRAALCVLAFLPLAIASGQTADTLQRIDQLFTRWNNATPGGVVTVERNGKLIYNKAFGMADLEHDVPNTTETIFESGSLSKQFTATAILLLFAEGKLALTDDVRKYVPELPGYGAVITIQQLLNHTSGLKDWGVIGGITGWPRTTRVYTQELALQIICKQRSLNFVPGSEYSYSNSNYSLLVTIVERVTKESLAEFTRIRIFEPAGMKHTQWRSNFRQVVPNRSIGYSRSGAKYEQDMPFENVHGHGGLLTTTGDLIQWNHQLATHEIGGDRVFQMRTKKGQLANKKEISYASGIVIGSVNGFKEINHTGATAGYRSVLGFYPEKKLSIAILSNDGSLNPGAEGRHIADIFLGKEEHKERLVKDMKSDSLWKFGGMYRNVRGFDTFTLDYSFSNDVITNNDKIVHVLHPDTLYLEGVYWIAKKPGQVLRKTTTDTATYVQVELYYSDIAYLHYLKDFQGTYYSTEADATYTIELRRGPRYTYLAGELNFPGDEIWVKNPPHPPFMLTPSFNDSFLSENGSLFEFKRTIKRAVEKLEISLPRAERIPFIRIRD